MNKILKNLISLSSSEIITRIIGLITATYLARVINPEGFGILGFSTAVVSYFMLMVVFGFDTYGMKEISKAGGKAGPFVNNVLTIRLCLAFIWYLILFIYVFNSGMSSEIKTVVLITGISLFSQAVSLNWFFQAIEKMWIIAARQIFASLLLLLGVVSFVQNSTGVWIAALLSSLTGLLNSVLLIYIFIKKVGKISLRINKSILIKIMSESWPIGVSFILISVYYNMDLLMMGYLRSEAETGIYNAAYKILLIFLIPFQLILNSFFPALSRIGLVNTSEFRSIIKNYGSAMYFAGAFSTVLLFLLAKSLVLFVFGPEYEAAAMSLSVLSMVPVVIALNMFWGNPLLAWGLQKYYIIAVAIGAVANIILNIWLIPRYSYLGASLATLLSEVAVFLGLICIYKFFVFRVDSQRNVES